MFLTNSFKVKLVIVWLNITIAFSNAFNKYVLTTINYLSTNPNVSNSIKQIYFKQRNEYICCIKKTPNKSEYLFT